MGILEFDDVHDALEGEFVEIETIAHVVVCGDSLGIVVDHHGAVSLAADGVEGLYATPVELYAGADAIGSGTEHDDGAAVVLVVDIVSNGRVAAYTAIGEIEVVGVGGILGGEGVYLLHGGHDAIVLSHGADGESGLGHAVEFLFESHGTGYLEIGEAIGFCLEQQLTVEGVHVVSLQVLVNVDDVLELMEEPAVNLGELVDALDVVVRKVHCLRDDEDALVGRLAEGLVDIGNAEFLVFHEAVHALPDHTQTFLDGLLEIAADDHHLAHGLHR